MELERLVEGTVESMGVHLHGKPSLIRRTQSFDGGDSGMERGESDFDDILGCDESQSPLHASFDVSQLSAYRHQERGSTSDFIPSSAHRTKVAAFTANCYDMLSTVGPSSAVPSTSKTPMRMRFSKSGSSAKSNKASGKRTPASARRHRLFTRRLSPAHRTPALFRSALDTSSTAAAPLLSNISVLGGQQPVHDLYRQEQPNHHVMEPPPPLFLEPAATPAHKKPPKRSLGTVTTVANSTILETTTETDGSTDTNHNHDFAAAQSFHFSAFPASLPRIPTHAPRKGSSQLTPTITHDDDGNSYSSSHSLPLPPPSEHGPIEQQISSLDEVDDMSTSPIGTPVGRRRLNFNSVLTPTGRVLPGTPKDVKLHFQGGQCSPIRGIPEEDGDLTRSTIVAKNSSLLSQSLGNSSMSSSQAALSRPMPDIHAFDGDSSQDGSTSDKGGSGSSTRSHPPSPKLLCPPTPVRTPAWVHAPSDISSALQSSSKKSSHLHKYGRQNSLITTKVLATCSLRDLEGRTSLENSLLEEDSKTQHQQSFHETSGNNSSILTIGESAGAATEPETDHASSDKEHEISPQKFEDDEDDGWLHCYKRGSKLFDDEREGIAMNPGIEVVSMSTSFEILGILGRGTFADVFKVRSRKDGKQYAVKKHRRQFRGKRDREITLSEVRHMQRLQSTNNHSAKSSYCLYLLFFYQAWQEDGHFFCQTELCCRDTCREFMDALRLHWVSARVRYPCLRRLPAPLGIAAGSDQDIIGRLVPEQTIWKICHDISAGLSHIHSYGLVHRDIKPSNIFLVSHPHFGAMCKIGDFGMAGDIGTSEDGQEGDQKYMAPELLASDVRHPSADMFSLGLTLYELASSLSFEVPAEGQLWHDLRSSANKMSEIPSTRDPELIRIIRLLVTPDANSRLSADSVLANRKVQEAGAMKDEFLMAYISDVEEDERRGQDFLVKTDDQTPRVLGRPRLCVSPSLTVPVQGLFSSPKQAHPASRV